MVLPISTLAFTSTITRTPATPAVYQNDDTHIEFLTDDPALINKYYFFTAVTVTNNVDDLGSCQQSQFFDGKFTGLDLTDYKRIDVSVWDSSNCQSNFVSTIAGSDDFFSVLATPVMYMCDGASCVESEFGSYNEATCNNECSVIPTTYYACSGVGGACQEDLMGGYSDPTCNYECSFTASTSLAINPAIFTGAVGAAAGMVSDNASILAYVFGIPLFLILVSVISYWIFSIKDNKKKIKKSPALIDDIPIVYDYKNNGMIAGGHRLSADEIKQDELYKKSRGMYGKKAGKYY